MAISAEVLHKAQRIRYEAFSKFATNLNKCVNYEAISAVLTSQIKFIFDCFIFRVYYHNHGSQLVFQGFQGKSIFFQNGDEIIYDFEKEVIKNGLPVNYAASHAGFRDMIAETILAHHQVASFSSLPIKYPFGEEILITIASKEVKQFIELDFTFLKLVCDLLSNKLSQLILVEDIAGKNKELEIKNKQITSLNRYLEDMVEQRTNELLEANNELSTLFYRTSHDFRAPLANIMGLVNVAALITKEPEILDLFKKCHSVVTGMDKMLIRLSYLTAPSTDDPVVEIDLPELLKNVREKFRENLNKCLGTLIADAALSRPFRSRARMLEAILEHIIDNAITFRKNIPKIEIKATQTNEHVMITIYDNGVGIHPLVLPKVFDMYYRGNAASAGNGLGLYIARKLLKHLQGEINIESEDGEYTLVTIKLPG